MKNEIFFAEPYIYYSLITSLLLYAAPLFAWLPSEIDNKMEKFQKRAHRLICGAPCTCSSFPSLASVRQKRAVSFLLSCEAFPDHPLHRFVPQRLPRTGHFRLPFASTSRRLRSFFPLTCQLANSPYFWPSCTEVVVMFCNLWIVYHSIIV